MNFTFRILEIEHVVSRKVGATGPEHFFLAQTHWKIKAGVSVSVFVAPDEGSWGLFNWGSTSNNFHVFPLQTWNHVTLPYYWLCYRHMDNLWWQFLAFTSSMILKTVPCLSSVYRVLSWSKAFQLLLHS